MSRLVLTLSLLATVSCSSCWSADFKALAARVPQGANAVLAIDVDSVLATPLAEKQGWQKKLSDGSRPIYLPPEASGVIVAAQLDSSRQFSKLWEAAVVQMKQAMPMRLVAKAEGGYIESIRDHEAAWVPSDAYIVSLSDSIMGLMHPANRQNVARWIDGQKAKSDGGASAAAAVDRIGLGSQIVMVIDLRDAAQAHRVHDRLSRSDIVAKHNLNVDELTTAITGLQQIVLQLKVTDKVTAKAEVIFGSDLKFDPAVAKELVLAALTSMGAELPGVKDWVAAVNDNKILLAGEMDTGAVRRVLSVLEIPTTKFSSLSDQDTASSSQDDIAQASLGYFHSVTTLVDDLEKRTKTSSGNSYWLDRYAQKIDRLPILHVDPELLDYGQKTAQTLRVISGSQKTANIGAGVAESRSYASGGGNSYSGNSYGYSNYDYGYGGGAYAAGDAAAAARSNLTAATNANATTRRAAAATGTASKIQGYKLIADATQNIRRTMTERYNVEF